MATKKTAEDRDNIRAIVESASTRHRSRHDAEARNEGQPATSDQQTDAAPPPAQRGSITRANKEKRRFVGIQLHIRVPSAVPRPDPQRRVHREEDDPGCSTVGTGEAILCREGHDLMEWTG